MGQMYNENTGWGISRIHGELRKLGYDIGQQTVRTHTPRHGVTPTPGWRTFLRNHKNVAPAMSVFGIVSVICFRLMHTMIVVVFDRVKIQIINSKSTEMDEKTDLVHWGSRGLVKLPWAKRLMNQRNNYDKWQGSRGPRRDKIAPIPHRQTRHVTYLQ